MLPYIKVSQSAHLFSSPLASLCFSLNATRSASAKPSCAVIKFTLAVGARPPFHLRPPVLCHQSPSPGDELLYRSGEPHRAPANAAAQGPSVP